MHRFSTALRAQQGTASDSDFAARLGITRAHWTRIKLGQRPVTLNIARSAIAQWPDLESVYLDSIKAALHGPDASAAQTHSKKTA